MAPLRKLMAETYTALARNRQHHIPTLILPSIVARNVSTFSHSSFHAFLRAFRAFKLSRWGSYRSYTGYHSCDGYSTFAQNLAPFFFAHLTTTTRLSIAASPDSLPSP
ncbi:uncharacterized protein BDZ99DRAFT_575146 [Mytilinidion resinicola]|uniref:Uncharacterized protein n=1 Tax=Mytilinidion resinicola TaxID=574789 RepID=A0A6A6YAE4_9PEZI|nr:uncharacterized protein BDZ99DRAFT_575146 [Mytilinidion resinicola]KAF2804974.1 hypothetical protein BDZ99DRAFT_575146 [Mytilinidion resinicola]